MKKLVNFVIDKRIFILILFNIFAIVSLILIPKVNINYEISEYLPSDSETRKGLDIMEENFDISTSSFNIMFDDLTDEERVLIKEDLKNTEGVSSVSYDDSSDYNKDNHTLYIISTDYDVDSTEATKVFKTITGKYKDYKFVTSGEIHNRNFPVLPSYVLVAAVAFGTVILIIMSGSYMEVFLFLFTILIAVLLNKGSNIIFSSVSNITDSISAILQLALSMDYSIMLMNRFNQEKRKHDKKEDAMKSALYNSFSSISSSSITTVVGLLALVFMSFTIGRDLGIVLAKGVIFSLISTFFVLPGLILLFDRLIEKTRKKEFNLNFSCLGKFAYKTRFFSIISFIVIFIASFIIKGNLGIFYIDNHSDNISAIYPPVNQIAVIYNNKDEKVITDYCREISDSSDFDSVLCYGNTLNEKLDYKKLKQRLNDLDVDTDIDDYLLRVIYYNKFNKTDIKVSLAELIKFTKNTVYKNKDISVKKSVKDNISKLEDFVDKDEINKKRSISDLSSILGIEESEIEKLLVYYKSLNTKTKLTINELLSFVNKNVLNNSNFDINKDTRTNIELLNKILDNKDVEMDKAGLMGLFGISENDMSMLITNYLLQGDIDLELSLHDFSEFILNNELISSKLNASEISSIKTLYNFTSKDIIEKLYSSEEIATLLNLDNVVVDSIFYGFHIECISIPDFIDILLNNNLVSDASTISSLMKLRGIINMVGEKFDYKAISSITDIDTSTTKTIYALVLSNSYSFKQKPLEFIDYVNSIESINNDKLHMLKNVIDSFNNAFSHKEMSELLNLDDETISLVYGLYDFKNNSNKISLNDFINFMNKSVINNKKYNQNISLQDREKVKSIKEIIDGSIKNKKYTQSEMSSLLSSLSKVDNNMLTLGFLYYGSENKYNNNWKMTIEELIDYLNDDILTDKKFDDYIKDDMRNDIKNAKQDIKDATEKLIGKNYSRMILTNKIETESSEMKKLIGKIKYRLKDTDSYIIGDAPMAAEMTDTFNGELNLITILTMIFIFVVVAVTFKSLIIPVILVLIIQCAVFTTMGILSLVGGKVYFISLLVVQAVLMGATIDYAIVYTNYFKESRNKNDLQTSLIKAYNKSMHTILTSSLILTSCTLVVAACTKAATAKICETISEGTICATVLIIIVLPGILAIFDKIVNKIKK